PRPTPRLRVRGLPRKRAAEGWLPSPGPAPTAGDSPRRATKLTYVQRAISSLTAEGQHDVAALLHSTLEWQFTRSLAHRQQPDKREATYIRVPLDADNPGFWGLATGRREDGGIHEDGCTTLLKAGVPYKLGGLGGGRATAGYDRPPRSPGDGSRRLPLLPGTPR